MDALRKKKIIVVTATGVILINVVLIIYVLLSGAMGGGQVDAVKIVAAVGIYKQQLLAAHLRIPPTVSAQELIARGLLAPADVKGLGQGEITISLMTAVQQRPTDPIIRVRAPDGHEMTVLADGSIQDVKK